jgi:uncharacterized protein DUF4337
MSEHEFHVHGAHEHEVEHQAHGGVGLAQYVAIFTALLSTLGAVASYQGAATQNEAMLFKNEAVLKKTEASDLWNFYQAKSSKGHLMELAAELAPANRQEHYKKQVQKYEQEKKEIKSQAEALEQEYRKANAESEQLLHPHHRLAQAVTLIQIAISLASITALTRRKWLFNLAGIAAAGGVALWLLALMA